MIQGELFEKENNLDVVLPASFLSEILRSINVRGFSVVALEFQDNCIRVRSFSEDGTEYLHVVGTHENMTINNAGYLIAPVTDFISGLQKFSGNVNIKWESGEKIFIYDTINSKMNIEFPPKSLSELSGVPEEDKIYPRNGDGLLQFPLRENGKWVKDDSGNNVMEPCATRVIVTPTELMKGIFDMGIAKAQYVIYNFSENESYSSSGKYYQKGGQSGSPIIADVDGEDVEIVIPAIIKEILGVMKDGSIEIQADKRYAMVFVISEKGDENYTICTTFGIVQFNPEPTE